MSRTQADRDEILEMFNEGLSASTIARTIGNGLTRNVVIGVVYRARNAGVVLRSAAPKRAAGLFVLPGRYVKAERMPPHAPKIDLVAPSARVSENGKRIGTLDLGAKDCRWPHGAVGTSDFHFCANTKTEGSPYCAYHAARAWRRASSKQDEVV